jgi:hypothetical protein
MIFNQMPMGIGGGQEIINIPDVPTVNQWVSPLDWPNISAVNSNEIKIIVMNNSYISFSVEVAGSGTYSIDWGDSSIENSIQSGTIKSHFYSENSGVSCDEGYKTNVIRIYNASGNINKWKVEEHPDILSKQSHSLLSFSSNCAFTDMSNMFFKSTGLTVTCPYLREIKISGITSTLTNISSFVNNCYSLSKISINSWGQITTLNNVFSNLKSLSTFISPSNWGSITSLISMFSGCESLNYIILPTTWGNVINTSNMFNGCKSLTYLSLPISWGGITDVSSMFSFCSSLIYLDKIPDWSLVTNISNLFYGCTSLITINEFPINWGNVTNASGLFRDCYSLKGISLPSTWGSIRNLSYFISGCRSLNKQPIIPSSWSNVDSINNMFSNTCIAEFDLPVSWGNITNIGYLFYNNRTLNTVSIPTSWGIVLNAESVFEECISLIDVTLPISWSVVNNTSKMFKNCKSLFSLIIPNSWSYVVSITEMFYGCESLKNITLPTAWLSSQNLSSLFKYCKSLQSITLPSDVFVGSSLDFMFAGCQNLKTVDMPLNWGSGVNSSISMFEDCSSLTTIELPDNWDRNYLSQSMFDGCSSLKKVIMPNSISKIATVAWPSDAFKDCISLQDIEFKNVDYTGNTVHNFNNVLVNAYNLRNFETTSLLNCFSIGGINSSNRSNLSSLRLYNKNSNFTISPYISVAYTAMNVSALETLFSDIPEGKTGRSITITGAIGASSISISNVQSTILNKVLTMPSVSNLTVGMEVYGQYVSGNRSVSINSETNTIDYNNHQLSNGTMVSFVNGSGNIVLNTVYYVVQATSNNFKISNTLNGTPITLTTTTTINMRAYPVIQSINTSNNTVTLNIPASGTGTSSVIASVLKRSIANLKGWSVVS